jgi:signal transduction histidine kinase
MGSDMSSPETVILEDAPVGLAVLRVPSLEYEFANPAFLALAGPAGEFVGRPLAVAHPHLAEVLAGPLAEVARSGAPHEVEDVALPPRPGEAAARFATFRLRALREGTARGPAVLVTADESTRRVVARARLQALGTIAAELDEGSRSLTETLERLERRACELLGADAASVLLADPDHPRFRGKVALGGARSVEVAADAGDLPAGAQAASRREPIGFRAETAGGLEAVWLKAASHSSALCAPLLVAERPLGLLYVTFRDGAPPAAADPRFVGALATACSIVIRRARILQREREAHLASQRATERLELLSESGAVLAAAVDWTTVVRTTAQLALGYLADAAVLDLVDPDGVLRREAQEVAGELPASFQQRTGDRRGVESPAIRDALLTRRTRRIALPAHGGVSDSGDPDLVTLGVLHAASCIIAPLVIRGQAAGVLTLVRRAPSPPHEPEDLELATELARRAAVALDQARLLAAAAEEASARDAFLAAAAHDIRSPLTALRLQVEALDRAPGVTERARPRVARLRSALDRISRRVEQVLDAARASPHTPITREPFDLAEQVRAIVTRVMREPGRNAVAVQVVAPEPVPGRWDRERVGAIVANLVTVAIKRGGEGVEVRITPVGQGARIEVRRPGAEDDEAARYGEDAARYEGLEVGTWIARRFAEAHGGQLRIVPLPKIGVRFVVDLPG